MITKVPLALNQHWKWEGHKIHDCILAALLTLFSYCIYSVFIVCASLLTNTSQNIIIGRQMFERDASLALSDARFLTEGMDTLMFHHPQSVRHYLPRAHSRLAVQPNASLYSTHLPY